MKTIITIIALAISTLTFAQDKEGVTITVVFDNLQSDEGKVSAALYDEANFMGAKTLGGGEGKPEGKKLSLVIENVQPGEYGIVSLHDLNGNGKMDFDGGMPTEPYGVSGNEMTMGPPNFMDAKFTVGTEDLTIKIRM